MKIDTRIFIAPGILEESVLNVRAQYSCGFSDPQVLSIIVVDRYLEFLENKEKCSI